ncbi:MAG TPA: hypothetical protein VN026_16150 [Bacteroidia bacterium]|jgi:hypothetical protein|nr:hypothetical protein [Bacteroidia bacterium]
MKKILLFIPLLLISLGSCKKDRSCSCSQNGTDLGTAQYTGVTRSEGKKLCNNQQAQYSLSNPGTTCTLK